MPTFTVLPVSLWLNRDPIGENGGINLYGYVQNNPVNAFDPLGLLTQEEADNIRNSATMGGLVGGAFLGGIGGGAGGFFLGLPTGPGEAVTVPAGAGIGALGGAIQGALIGRIAGEGYIVIADFMQGRWWEKVDPDSDRCPSGGKEKMAQGDNTAKNKEFNDALKELGIKPGSKTAEQLHDAITGKGLQGMKDIVNFAKTNGIGP